MYGNTPTFDSMCQLGDEQFPEFAVCSSPDQGSNEASTRRASDNTRQQGSIQERLHHAKMV